MQLYKRFLSLLILPLLVSGLLAYLVDGALAHRPATGAAPHQQLKVEASQGADRDTAVHATRRISIPFGFAPHFDLLSGGDAVLVKGHGSCTDGENFTIAVTVTHDAAGTTAHGGLTGICAGEEVLQNWQITAAAESEPLPPGPAETCGLVHTLNVDAYATDRQEWCVSVRLGETVYLPAIVR